MAAMEGHRVQSFGRYRILGRLGRGGMGSVYLAEQTGPGTFNRKVALKLLRVDDSLGEEYRLMLIDEAQLTASLNHPNVVTVYEAGEYDGRIFIALEWVCGINLATLIRRTPLRLPLAVSAALLAQACEGLHAAHELRQGARLLNLIHRDVSPANLMVDPDGRVRVIDFGIARADIRRVTTAPQFIRGNPAYMAPEQFQGLDIDRRVDIYTTALVFYELCTGVHPFNHGPLRAAVAPLRALCPDLCPALGRLVDASLELLPEDRPGDIAQLGTAMGDFARRNGFTRPADLARYFAGAPISLAPPEPVHDTNYAELRRESQRRPTSLVRAPQPPSSPAIQLSGTAVQRIDLSDGQFLWIYPLHIRATDRAVHEMAVSRLPNLLPAPLQVRYLGEALSLECGPPAPSAPRAALYLDAQRPGTRLERMLISAVAPCQTFDLGHRKHTVRRLHYAVASAEAGGLVARPPGPIPSIVAPADCCMLVVFTVADANTGILHAECVCIERSSY